MAMEMEMVDMNGWMDEVMKSSQKDHARERFSATRVEAYEMQQAGTSGAGIPVEGQISAQYSQRGGWCQKRGVNNNNNDNDKNDNKNDDDGESLSLHGESREISDTRSIPSPPLPE